MSGALGGRPPGSRNKKTQALIDQIEEMFPGINPVAIMLEAGVTGRLRTFQPRADGGIGVDPEAPQTFVNVDLGDRAMYLKESTQYLTPKLKAIEHSGEINTQSTTTVLLPGQAPDLATWAKVVTENAAMAATQPSTEIAESLAVVVAEADEEQDTSE